MCRQPTRSAPMRVPAFFSTVLILALLIALAGLAPPLPVRAAGIVFYVNATVAGGANDGSSWASL